MKTQKEIDARLKAYANGTVNSPYRIKKPTSYDNRFGRMEIGAIDVDQSFHAQCLDLIIDYVLWLTDNKVRMWGDAKNSIDNVFPSGWKIVKNQPSTIPKKGWIAVYTKDSPTYIEFGHIGIVNNGGNTSQFQILEQNWNGLANKKPSLRWDNYYGLTHFIVPPISKNKVTNAVKETVDKVTSAVKPSNKMNILLVAGHGKGYMSNDPGATGNGTNERDFIRKNIVPNVAKYLKDAGHTVSYYGGSSMGQDLYQDTAYGYNIGDTSKYGMYWVAKQKYDAIIEFHLDAASPAASGGHVIIGKGLAADTIDKGIQSAIVKHVGQIRPIDPRDNLLNVNIAKQLNLNYRLVELGFITSKKDMDYIKENIQAYTKDIAEAISGGTITPSKDTPTPKPASKPTTSKPSTNTTVPNSVKVGAIPPTTLKNQKDFYFKAKVRDGLTVCEYKNGDYQLTDMVYLKGHKDFRVFEIKNGWCRIYSNTSNLWVWRERIIIYELGKTSTSSKPKPKTAWNWSGKFTANTTIKVRKTASLANDKNVVESGSWIYKGQYIKFVELRKVVRPSDKKKFWMGKFKYESNPSAGYFYAALGEITDKQEKFVNEKKLYGTAKITKKR